MVRRPRLPNWPASSGRFVMEAVLIVASVALGFVVNEWRQAVADRELAARVIRNVRAEVEHNLATIGPQVTRHQQIIKTLAVNNGREGQGAWDVLVEALPDRQGFGLAPPRQAAWDAAVSSGAFRLIDYDLAAAISEIYVTQDRIYGSLTDRVVQAIYIPEMFDPATRGRALPVLRMVLTEMEGNERYVLELYEKHLPALRAAPQ
jgi:hypothetical protein